MTETENLVLEQLCAIRTDIDLPESFALQETRLTDGQAAIRVAISALRQQVAGLTTAVYSGQNRLADIERRIDRIEKRLELTEASSGDPCSAYRDNRPRHRHANYPNIPERQLRAVGCSDLSAISMRKKLQADCSLVNHSRVGKVVPCENSSSSLLIFSRRCSSSADSVDFMQ